MANGRNKSRKGDSGRDPGSFVALPWSVLDCPAYARLSHPAKALLLEVARQFVRDNNGRMLLSRAYLATRGWKSADTITNAKRELLAGGFIFQTVMGHRPNKASWYAVTWRALDKMPGYDEGAAQLFERGVYQKSTPLIGASLKPPAGTERAAIVPPTGTETVPTVPPAGTIRAVLGRPSVPPAGHHLEMPSTAALKLAPRGATKPAANQIGSVMSKPALVDAAVIETIRVRDHDLDPALYDETTGEHFQRPPASARRQRQAADEWVNAALCKKAG
jgi:hypothetical protein